MLWRDSQPTHTDPNVNIIIFKWKNKKCSVWTLNKAREPKLKYSKHLKYEIIRSLYTKKQHYNMITLCHSESS